MAFIAFRRGGKDQERCACPRRIGESHSEDRAHLLNSRARGAHHLRCRS